VSAETTGPRSTVEAETCGGDLPGWEGRIADHRNGPPAPLDLSTPAQVHDLVTTFYREIVFDEVLEPVFGEVAEVDWAEHIPRLIDYWCWILFGTDPYRGAVTRTHRHLHERKAIEPLHCDRWFSLWTRCIDERWAGPCADHAKRHAQTLMAGMAKRIFGFTWPQEDAGAAPNC
jgi:hemoglobin